MTTYKIARWIKQGDTASDFIGGGMANALIGGAISHYGGNSVLGRTARMAHSTANMAGNVHGFMSKAPTIADIKEMDKNTAIGFAPGVSQSRLLLRRRAIRNLLNEDKQDRPVSEILGRRLNPLASGVIGSGFGALTGGVIGARSGNAGNGALVGGVVGLPLGALTGAVSQRLGTMTAGLTKRRSLEEQYDYENRNNWLRHILVPGAASYDYYKGLGAAKHLSEMEEDDINKEVARIRKARGIK